MFTTALDDGESNYVLHNTVCLVCNRDLTSLRLVGAAVPRAVGYRV
jgi:hypothetical protein